MIEDQDFPKLRTPDRPNVEWLKSHIGPVVTPKALDGILVNLPSGGIAKVPEGTVVEIGEDGWLGTDEP
jgi:hypothetical protein